MDFLTDSNPQPKYTWQWLGVQCVYLFIIVLAATGLISLIDHLASERTLSGLLPSAYNTMFSQATSYGFALVALSLLSITVMEINVRRPIQVLQYILIALSLVLFYLMLLAFAERIPFIGAYIIAAVMTVGLITWFVNCLMADRKATGIIAGLITGEFIMLFVLINLGSAVLLVGSLLLFALIAVIMFLSLKLRVENDELVIK